MNIVVPTGSGAIPPGCRKPVYVKEIVPYKATASKNPRYNKSRHENRRFLRGNFLNDSVSSELCTRRYIHKIIRRSTEYIGYTINVIPQSNARTKTRA